MTEVSTTKKAIKSTAWKLSERLCAQLVSLVVSIVIARILGPEEYGIIGIITIFFNFANILITNGFSTALIQKKEYEIEDYSTTVVSSFIFSLIIYAIIFFVAPFIAKVYEEDRLCLMLRIMGLIIPVNAIKSVLCAYISSNFLFKKFFFATIIGTVISSVVGIYMAYSGYGAWSLIFQQMTNIVLDTIILAISIKIWFGLKFSFNRFKYIFKYSWSLMISGLLGTTYNEITPAVIGIKYTKSDLSFFEKGRSFPVLISSSTTSTLSAVLFPFLSKCQNDKEKLLGYTRKYIQVSSFFSFPMMLGFFAVSSAFVNIVLGEEWAFCIPYIQIFCISGMFDVIHVGNCEVIKAMGKSKTYLVMEIIKKSLYFAIIILFLIFSNTPLVLSCSFILCTVVAILVNSIPNRKYLDYKAKDQILDLLPNLLTSIIMGISIYLLNLLHINSILLLLLQIFIGGIIYIGIAYISRNMNLKYSINIVKSLFKKTEVRNINELDAEEVKEEIDDMKIVKEYKDEEN